MVPGLDSEVFKEQVTCTTTELISHLLGPSKETLPDECSIPARPCEIYNG